MLAKSAQIPRGPQFSLFSAIGAATLPPASVRLSIGTALYNQWLHSYPDSRFIILILHLLK